MKLKPAKCVLLFHSLSPLLLLTYRNAAIHAKGFWFFGPETPFWTGLTQNIEKKLVTAHPFTRPDHDA